MHIGQTDIDIRHVLDGRRGDEPEDIVDAGVIVAAGWSHRHCLLVLQMIGYNSCPCVVWPIYATLAVRADGSNWRMRHFRPGYCLCGDKNMTCQHARNENKMSFGQLDFCFLTQMKKLICITNLRPFKAARKAKIDVSVIFTKTSLFVTVIPHLPRRHLKI